MMKPGFPFRIWTAMFCAVFLSGTSRSDSALAGIVTFGIGTNAFNMEFVAIGNANNADDTTGAPNPAGSVAYEYQIGKYEVSDNIITKFNASQSLQITKTALGPDKPATQVSWNEAARFVNWLNTSQGFQAAYNFTTSGVNDNIALWSSTDAWQLGGENLFRHKDSHFWLPSMDEWYKAAYYNPLTSTYSDYTNGTDIAPTAVASGTTGAVYNGQTGPADITLAGGLSPYGVMGLGGNVYEWEETSFDLSNSSGSSVRGIRGGSADHNSIGLLSSSRYYVDPAYEAYYDLGFRVASLSSSAAAVPEPSSFIMFATMTISALWYRRRMRN